jgi:hypothetical protein
MNGIAWILLASLASAGTGCASRQWIAPSMAGTVVDERTGGPLAGVEILRKTDRSDAVPVGESAFDGSFRIEPERATVRRIPVGDPLHAGHYAFRLDGYKEQRRPFGIFGYDVLRDDPPSIEDGTIRLEHKPATRSPASGPKPLGGKWLAELAGAEGVGFTAYPQPLGWQGEHPESYTASFLVVGTRPAGDKPEEGVTLHGAKRTDADWVVADGSGALWVTGLPAPEPGVPVVLSGRFTTEGALALKGIRFLVFADKKGKTVARAGDFVYYTLSGNKSATCPVEIDGDAAAVAFTDERDALIIRAVKPGTAKIRIYSLWFTEDAPKLQQELLLTVE